MRGSSTDVLAVIWRYVVCAIFSLIIILDEGATDKFPFYDLADKSMSILLGRPICLRDEDCTLHFPKEVDDE